MKRSWLVWLSVSLLLSLYFAAGHVASRTDVVTMRLEPGASTDVKLLRLANDQLRMELMFRGKYLQRPELGESQTNSDWQSNGVLKFAKPGAGIRVVASLPNQSPVTYEAMPVSGFGDGALFRRLTSDLSVETGVWRWPPRFNNLALQRGSNVVRIDVAVVDPRLAGETVQLRVQPALGFKNVSPSLMWLWWWFLWPIIIPAQLIWAGVLGFKSWKIYRAA
jgi:hypothetical protein